MQFTRDPITSKLYIQSYDTQQGIITVNQAPYTDSLILFEGELIKEALPRSFEALTPAHLLALLEHDADVFILGTGPTQQHIPYEWRLPFIQKQKPLEVMSTEAAAQTYNMLAEDARAVCVGLVVG